MRVLVYSLCLFCALQSPAWGVALSGQPAVLLSSDEIFVEFEEIFEDLITFRSNYGSGKYGSATHLQSPGQPDGHGYRDLPDRFGLKFRLGITNYYLNLQRDESIFGTVGWQAHTSSYRVIDPQGYSDEHRHKHNESIKNFPRFLAYRALNGNGETIASVTFSYLALGGIHALIWDERIQDWVVVDGFVSAGQDHKQYRRNDRVHHQHYRMTQGSSTTGSWEDDAITQRVVNELAEYGIGDIGVCGVGTGIRLHDNISDLHLSRRNSGISGGSRKDGSIQARQKQEHGHHSPLALKLPTPGISSYAEAAGALYKQSRSTVAEATDLLQDCPNDAYALHIGVAMDYGFVARNGGVDFASEHLMRIINAANTVYADQVHVVLVLGTVVMYSSSGGPDWNEAPSGTNTRDCGATINEKLDMFSRWRSCCSATDGASRDTQNGLWHLLTNCYPVQPGGGSVTVGLAGVGVLCMQNSIYCENCPENEPECQRSCYWGSCANGQFCSSGTAVTSYYVGGRTWMTFAHEIGHNFGARHTTNGLMSHDKTSEQRFLAENAGQVCEHISDTLNGYTSHANCLVHFQPECGNGVVEHGEECDDDSACCDQSLCVLAEEAQCSSSVTWTDFEAECCNFDTCQFRLPDTSCGTSSEGYCSNGECITPVCSDHALQSCAIESSNICQERCSYAGNCTHPDASISYVTDGTICDTNKSCFGGECLPGKFVWRTTSWSECDRQCGYGLQYRDIYCERDDTGRRVSNSFCGEPVPLVQRICHVALVDCGSSVYPAWEEKRWSSCSDWCNGTQSTDYDCVSQSGTILDEVMCTGTRPAQISRLCNVDCVPPEQSILGLPVWAAVTVGACAFISTSLLVYLGVFEYRNRKRRQARKEHGEEGQRLHRHQSRDENGTATRRAGGLSSICRFFSSHSDGKQRHIPHDITAVNIPELNQLLPGGSSNLDKNKAPTSHTHLGANQKLSSSSDSFHRQQSLSISPQSDSKEPSGSLPYSVIDNYR
eukprot:Clim_evm17s239 gene=Clim_evmTU17s239